MDTQNFQNLQEISKKILGSYVAKAGEDLRRNKNKEFLRRGDAEYHESGGNRHTGPNPELAAKAREDAKRYSHKADRRAKGLAMAGKKIANELEEGKLKNALIAGAIGAAMGAGAGVATPHLSDFKSTIQDKVGQTVGIEKVGNTERAKQGIRSQIGLGHDTPAGARAGIAGAAGGALGVASAFRRRKTNESTTHEESSLEEYVNNVVKSILEDVFDSNQSSRASRANIETAKKKLGAKSPHTQELAKLHTKMRNSRFVYGIADNEVNRRAFGDENYGKKPTLTPMKGKAFSGYDAIGGTSDRSVNTGIIKKAAAAIRRKNKGR